MRSDPIWEMHRAAERRGIKIQAGRDVYLGHRMEFGSGGPVVSPIPTDVWVAQQRQARIDRNRARLRTAMRWWAMGWMLVGALALPLQTDTGWANMAATVFMSSALGAMAAAAVSMARMALRGVLW